HKDLQKGQLEALKQEALENPFLEENEARKLASMYQKRIDDLDVKTVKKDPLVVSREHDNYFKAGKS
ncbi:hypothetical protein HC823_01670, partial [Candidatus Gracilibacteria bacterium]|nr:hypothetical protein [Candidatus Gracilibacteria bacterium]